MNFKQWYNEKNEVGTGTNSVAVFARPIFGADLVGRTWPPFVACGSEEEGNLCRSQGKPEGVNATGCGCGDGSRKKN